MDFQKVKVYGGGKVSIPAKFRQELKIAEGDTLVAEVRDDLLVLRPANASLKKMQARLRELNPERRSLVDELIAGRREDAACE